MSERSLTWRVIAYAACAIAMVLATAVLGHLYASQLESDKRAADTEKRVRVLESKEEANTVRWEFVKAKLEEMSKDLKKHVEPK